MFGALPDIAAKRAELAPGDTALIEHATGRSLTYADLERRAGQAAGLLTSLGVAAGDRVACLCRNRSAVFELLFACAKLGAIFVPLNWRMPPAELAPLIADCTPKLLFHGVEDEAAALAVAKASGVASVGLDGDYENRLGEAPNGAGREWWPSEEPWYLLYTSGTTGTPKAVIQTYRMAWVNTLNIGQAIGLTAADRTLCFLPLFHAGGMSLHALPTLFTGGQVTVLPGFDADTVIDLIEAGRADTVFGVPAIYRELVVHPRFADLDLGKVRHWGSGGAALSLGLVETFAARGAALCSGMGMTETGPTAFLIDQDHALAKAGSVGKAQVMTRVRITLANGREAGDEEMGELQFAGPGVTPGYWNKPAATAEAFTDDGWLKTGDLARRDADGYVYIVGRSKEMFISGGENVYPAEVEAALIAHPAVSEACVIGVADERWGEVGRAFVTLNAGASATPDALARHCRERLAAFKTPKVFVIVPDLPRNALGKVQKHLLASAEALA